MAVTDRLAYHELWGQKTEGEARANSKASRYGLENYRNYIQTAHLAK
jgi:hypothetical protein